MIIIAAFLFAILPLASIKVTTMGEYAYFFESITPFSYWISVGLLFSALFIVLSGPDDPKANFLLVFSSIALMIVIRCVYPIIFTSVVTFEPDSANYINVVSSWINNGVDLGRSGNYQHDYPLSFFIAFLFGKLGAPIEVFYRLAPLAVYALDLILVYFIVTFITSKPKIGAISVFLFSFTPLNYWLAVHFCPDLIGSLFFLLSLYLVVKLVKSSELTLFNLLPVLISVVLLVLSHHLGTLYFIVTMVGLAFSYWFFSSKSREKSLRFLLIGIFTYTFWFAYGTFMYPEFFNVYSYFGQAGSAVSLAMQADLFENFTFALYPALIFSLVLIYLHETIGLRSILKFLLSKRFFMLKKVDIQLAPAFQFSAGFSFVLALFFVGIVLPAIFAPRVLEIVLIGLYPIAATQLLKLTSEQHSKKVRMFLYILLLIIILLGIHRYYTQIQGRVLNSTI